MINDLLKDRIKEAVRNLSGEVVENIQLEHPAVEEHGDYSTNIALTMFAKFQILNSKFPINSPRDLAEKIVSMLKSDERLNTLIDEIQVAGAGFINFYLRQSFFTSELEQINYLKSDFGKNKSQIGKKIMVEFAHPNTHKEMHIGHMRTLITGESLSRILEFNGAQVFRANYQGDIGPHVAKSIWGTEQLLKIRQVSWDEAEKLSFNDKAHLLGEGYVKGNQDYEEKKLEIDDLNKFLYQKDDSVWQVYERTRRWSLDYYEQFYQRFYTKFDRYYFESEIAETGKNLVIENVGKVFESSQEAIVFSSEKHGLHTRVFVTKDGNPTYEAKEMALAPLQYQEFPFDQCIHVVANEQTGYFQVVFKALEMMDADFVGKEFHLSMGMVQLIGKKISSRTGVIVTVDGLLEDVKELLKPLISNKDLKADEIDDIAEKGTLAAVKYSVLKTGTGQNVAFGMEKSVSLQGDSGPYLQYTYARCRSVEEKFKVQSSPMPFGTGQAKFKVESNVKGLMSNVNPEELRILRWIYRFPEVVEQAGLEYAPNYICTFLFELAQRFNTFYNQHSILQAESDELKIFRLQLTASVAQVLQNGLRLLGIEAPERM